MMRKDRVRRARSCRTGIMLLVVGSVALMGCGTAHQEDTGIKGGDSGCKYGPFKRRTKFAPDAPAPAPGAFDILIGEKEPSASSMQDPNLLGYSGGRGDGGYEFKHCY